MPSSSYSSSSSTSSSSYLSRRAGRVRTGRWGKASVERRRVRAGCAGEGGQDGGGGGSVAVIKATHAPDLEELHAIHQRPADDPALELLAVALRQARSGRTWRVRGEARRGGGRRGGVGGAAQRPRLSGAPWRAHESAPVRSKILQEAGGAVNRGMKHTLKALRTSRPTYSISRVDHRALSRMSRVADDSAVNSGRNAAHTACPRAAKMPLPACF